jgi:hypothetical protein
MRDALTKYAGVINIGPFGCMPVRFTESVLLPITDAKSKRESYRKARREPDFAQFSEEERIPFLTIEADGNPYPQLLEARFESFCLQAARIADKQGKRPALVEDKTSEDTAGPLSPATSSPSRYTGTRDFGPESASPLQHGEADRAEKTGKLSNVS